MHAMQRSIAYKDSPTHTKTRTLPFLDWCVCVCWSGHKYSFQTLRNVYFCSQTERMLMLPAAAAAASVLQFADEQQHAEFARPQPLIS